MRTAAATNPAKSVMAELRAATWPCHQRLEKRLDVKARFADRHRYRSHLEQMWGYCEPLERRIAHVDLGDALSDGDARRKIPLLGRDLAVLGMDRESIAGLARCERVPSIDGAAAALGSLYVMEGATLGGRMLLPLVASNLGYGPGRGASFLASYGTDTDLMWARFAASLDAWCADPGRRESAVIAAVATFEALEYWLCGTPP
jgi:heme oxygenase